MLGADGGCDGVCTLATIEAAPSALEVNGADVFYCSNREVWKLSTSGGTPKLLGALSGPCTPMMFVDDTDVWILAKKDGEAGVVASVSKSGGQPSVTYEDTRGLFAFGVDADNVYWIDGGGVIRRRPKTFLVEDTILVGGPVELRVAPLRVDGHRLYWLSPTGLSSISVAGGQAQTSDLPETPTSFRVDSGVMYWTGPTQGVVRTPVSFGNSVTLTSADASAASIVLTSAFVYWTESSRVARVSKNGGVAETVAPDDAKLVTANDRAAYCYANGQLRMRKLE